MSFSWKEAAESEARGKAPRIPPTKPNDAIEAQITKVIFADKDGKAFTSSKGDPQILIVYADEQSREAAQMYTLSETAGWSLAKVLKASGANVEKMDAAGVRPEHFSNSEWGTKQLVGRRLLISVAYDEKDYPVVTPVMRQPTAPQAQHAPQQKPAGGFNPEANLPAQAAAPTQGRFAPGSDIPF